MGKREKRHKNKKLVYTISVVEPGLQDISNYLYENTGKLDDFTGPN